MIRAAVTCVLLAWGALVCAALTGCPGLPPPDGCTPLHTRCSPKGVPQTCSQSQRWTGIGRACAEVGAVCCRTISPYGRELHACVPVGACVAEPDAGAEAGAEGGAQ